MNKHRLILVSALLAVAGAGTSAGAGSVDCKLKFTISGWSAFYKRSDGTGEFSGVDDIKQLLGTYASAEAEAGAVKSAKAHIVTKGNISLALAGTGEGWEVGVAFGKFQILRN
jgi:hypothetical protein